MMHCSKLLTLVSLVLSHCGSHVAAAPIQENSFQVACNNNGPTATAAGRLFALDGKVQYFTGTNAWWLGHLFYKADIDQALNQIASSGLKTARVWAFGNTNNPATEGNIYYQSLNSSGGFINYDPNKGIGVLDYAVQQAAKLNIKLIMVLLNNFDGLGGINTYQTAFGLTTKQAFYTDAKTQQAYRDYIKFIVKRYQNSGAVFSWELCNEPRCSGCDPSVITNWASITSRYIRTLDNRHLVAVGDEGWLLPSYKGGDGSYPYSGYEGVDHIALTKIPTIDYSTIHLYPDQWGKDYAWGSTWLQQHNDIAKSIGKPLVLEEYSAPDAATRAQWLPQWQATLLKNTSIASDSIWQFGSTFPEENPYDNYAVYYSQDPNSEFQKLVINQAKAMAAKAPRATA